jgi:phage shock protein E
MPPRPPSTPSPLRRQVSRSAIALLVLLLGGFAAPSPGESPDNPAIDMRGYLRAARQAAKHRESRRLSEDEFLVRQRQPGVLVLDARSREAYDLLHVAGAISLPFPDLAVDSLRRAIPDRGTTILIYCNNNFANAPEPFPTKMATASLNLSTYIALWMYGYRNVYELGPLVDLADSKLPFASAAPAPAAESAASEKGAPPSTGGAV